MYIFSNSFCTHITNSEKFIENLSYRKRCYIHYKRGGVGERSRSSTVRDAYDVNPTRFPPDPRHLPVQFAGVGLYTWVLGCICRRLAQNGGGGPYTLALGRAVWRWAVHAGVWLETKVLGPYTLALGSRRRSWSYTVAFGSKYRCWIVHAGVRL